MSAIRNSVERIAAMPGPAWLRDGIGLLGYVFFLSFTLMALFLLLGRAGIRVPMDVLGWVRLALPVGYLGLAGIVLRLSPAPLHFAWGHWLLLFITLPLMAVLEVVMPDSQPEFWRSALVYAFCGAGVLEALVLFVFRTGEKSAIGVASGGLLFVLGLALSFYSAGPVLWLELFGLAIFGWLIAGDYLSDGGARAAGAGKSLRFSRPAPRGAGPREAPAGGEAAVHGLLSVSRTSEGFKAKALSGDWGERGGFRIVYDDRGLPAMYWLEPRHTPDTMNFGDLPFSTVRSVSWIKRALFVHFDDKAGPLLLSFQTEPAPRQWPLFFISLLGCFGVAALLATSRAPFLSDPYLQSIAILSPAVFLAALFLEFGLRPHECGGSIEARPWLALESFESTNAVDHHVHPENDLDEGVIMAYFYRSIPSIEALRGIFNRQTMVEFSRAFVWEFLERRKEVVMGLEEQLRGRTPPQPQRAAPSPSRSNRPSRL